ncbi:MAG: hypothetical protein A3I33_00785 [Candidatus Colwellbacteria bacterium RIFCSPLOWO2_02_FULL_45_11]|uniref:Uncharacterized protein n=1 Tax=Candidatus Colwellbacteria bacterium RIFCSPLOWO2_02_FULL_45_11 TaxID=1797692 RepID=A0A1G1ZD37_9BACT|nr:MAG: hypothetical protein A3I33_00785 [Candidatus Colwellbacteria bacterium RIFCSPLOWO2_02_FULL_45_11]
MFRNRILQRMGQVILVVALLLAFASLCVGAAVRNQDANDRVSCEASYQNTGQVTDKCAELLGGR